MTDIFLKILNMSISASWIVLVVLLLRFILKKSPKWINCVLWGIVGLRLTVPFSIESVLSLIPSAQTIDPGIMTDTVPAIDSGVPVINSAVNPIIGTTLAPTAGASANPFQIIMPILSVVWLIGIVLLLVYTLVSYLRLKRKIGTAVKLYDNIYQSENVVSPFVLGIIKPKIYLPFNMSEDNMQSVIAHETAHIKRKDYLWKPLGFLILTVYWFNPVMWLSYILLCRDIELACDEKVVKDFDKNQKADYSEALLTCSVSRRSIAACPIAFGEVGVKNRVKSVLSYKKPSFWIIAVAVVASIAVAVCFLTNPKESSVASYSESLDSAVSMAILEDNNDAYYTHGTESATEGHIIYGTEVDGNIYTVYMLAEYNRFGFMNGYFVSQSGGRGPAVMTFEKKDGRYNLQKIQYPEDGERYAESVEEMFPSEYRDKVMNPSQKDRKSLWSQCTAYASSYLLSIGRTEEIRNYSEVEHTSLTDVGVTVEASNKFAESKLPYNWDIGYYEALEDGTRYVYRTDYDKDRNLIICTKEKYDTKETIERLGFDGSTGDIVTLESYPVNSETEQTVSVPSTVPTTAPTTASVTDNDTEPGANPYFNAEVLEVHGNSILVKPDDDSNEILSSDKIFVSTDVFSDIPVPTIKVGDKVRVIYNGEIAETYPSQIRKVFVIYLLSEDGAVLSPTPLQ